jgi:hypothetical protein
VAKFLCSLRKTRLLHWTIALGSLSGMFSQFVSNRGKHLINYPFDEDAL